MLFHLIIVSLKMALSARSVAQNERIGLPWKLNSSCRYFRLFESSTYCSIMIYGEKMTNLHFSLLEMLFCTVSYISQLNFTLNLVITQLRRKDFYPGLLLPAIFFNESLSICRAHLFKRKAEFILSNTVLLKISVSPRPAF